MANIHAGALRYSHGCAKCYAANHVDVDEFKYNNISAAQSQRYQCLVLYKRLSTSLTTISRVDSVEVPCRVCISVRPAVD